MIIKCKHQFLSISCLLATLFCGNAFGQEEGRAEDESESKSESESIERPFRLYFIDKPIEIDSSTDDRAVWPITKAEVISEDDPQFIRRMGSIREYTESVQAIESEGGVWDRGLIEGLATLGELHQRQGDHITAIKTFDRVVHVSRINNGLHTLEQIPALEQKIESFLVLLIKLYLQQLQNHLKYELAQ